MSDARGDGFAWRDIAQRARESSTMRALKAVAVSFGSAFAVLASLKSALETTRWLTEPVKAAVGDALDAILIAGVALLLTLALALLYELARFLLRRAPIGSWSLLQTVDGTIWCVFLEPGKPGTPGEPVAVDVGSASAGTKSMKLPQAAGNGSVALSLDGKFLAALSGSTLRVLSVDVVDVDGEPTPSFTVISGMEIRFEAMQPDARVAAVSKAAGDAFWVAIVYRDTTSRMRMHVLRVVEPTNVDFRNVVADPRTVDIAEGPGFGGVVLRKAANDRLQALALGTAEVITRVLVRLRGEADEAQLPGGPEAETRLIQVFDVDRADPSADLLKVAERHEESVDDDQTAATPSPWLVPREGATLGEVVALDAAEVAGETVLAVLTRRPFGAKGSWSWIKGQIMQPASERWRWTRLATRRSGSELSELQVYVGRLPGTELVLSKGPLAVQSRWARGIVFVRQVGIGVGGPAGGAADEGVAIVERILLTDGAQVKPVKPVAVPLEVPT